jgi:hypothetical protein
VNLAGHYLRVIGVTNPRPWQLLDRKFVLDGSSENLVADSSQECEYFERDLMRKENHKLRDFIASFNM